MNVYFNASIAGKKRFPAEFKTIVSVIESLGHKVYSDHVLKRDPEAVNKQTRKQHEADFQKAREEIQKSEVMIVEATYPSIGVGHTTTIALEMHKSVLILHQNDPHGLLIGDPNRLLFLKKYRAGDKQMLKKIIRDFLEKASKRLLNVRFNLMIDETEENYLEWVSKIQKISKADYIRQLIDNDLKNDNDYDNFS